MIRIYPVKKNLYPRHVFRISRASRPLVQNVFIVLEQKGVMGYGEASPNAFFGEDPLDVEMSLAGLADYFRRQTLESPEDIARIWEEIWVRVAPSRACQCAVDIALWDLLTKQAGVTVAQAALGRPAIPVATSATLGLCEPEAWPARVAEVREFPAVKVKMDASAGLDLLRFIREQGSQAIRVDANCSWSGRDVPKLAGDLAGLGVEFIEQPLPPAENHRMEDILSASPLPIFADESCFGPADVENLPGRFSGFNIKLVKCGGLTPALAMLRRGKQLGLQVMVGCMLESSLLISAGFVAAQGADYADLDGSWLLKEDVFAGLSIRAGRLLPSGTPGLGVEPKFPPVES